MQIGVGHELVICAASAFAGVRKGNTAMVTCNYDDGFLTVNQVLENYEIGRTTFYSLAAAGAFPLIKIGRATRVSKQAVRDWAAGLESAAVSK